MIYVGVIAAALVVQIIYLVEAGADPMFWHPVIDADEYDRMARAIAFGPHDPAEPYSHPPLYPYFLSLVYRFADGQIAVARAVQALIHATTCGLVWMLARVLFDRRTACLAAVMLILWGPMIFFVGELLPVVLVVFLNVLTVWLWMWAYHQPDWRRWLVFGVVLGLAALAMPNILILLPIAAGLLVIAAVRERAARPLAHAAFCVLGTLAAIAPVTVRNHMVSGQFVPISVGGGMNFYIGNNPDAFETAAIRPGPGRDALRTEPEHDGVRTEQAASRYFYARAFDFMREQPGAFLRNLGWKARLFVNARELPRDVDLYLFRDRSRLLGLLAWTWGSFAYPWGLAAPPAVVGLILAWRRNPRSRPLAVYLVAYSATIILVLPAARCRLAVVPAVVIFGAWALVWAWEHLRRRHVGRVLAALGLTLAVAAGVNWPVTVPTDAVRFQVELHHFLGLRGMAEGEPDMAERQLRQAAELDPDDAAVQVSLGNLLRERGAYEEARQRFGRARVLDSRLPSLHRGMGDLAAVQEQWDEAIAHYIDALRLHPAGHDARVALIEALVRRQRFDEAVVQCRMLLHRGRAPGAAHQWLGVVRLEQGRPGEAVEHLDEALAFLPDDPALAVLLAEALLADGQPNRALNVLDGAVILARSQDRAELVREINARRAQLAHTQPGD